MRLRSAPAVGVLALSLATPGFTGMAAPPPDVASWAMMILGFGVSGMLLRMRRRTLAL